MSCHSASVRSEVYRIRSVLRECIYIVQTKIADFIDAFWVFKQALTGARFGPESAQTDLDEAWEVAVRGPMKLYMADIHLYRARLYFRANNYPWNQNPDGTPRGPADDLAAAEKLIND